MGMLLRFPVFLLPVLFVSCIDGPEQRVTALAEKPRTETVHVRVDDAVLAGDDPFAVIEPVWDACNIYDSLSEYQKSLSPFSRPQRLLVAIQWYVAEVNNGGHDQFYFNSTGIVWPDAAAGFREVGLPEIAEIVEESSRRMGGASREREERWRQLDELKPNFDDLDDLFYELAKSLGVDPLMMEYARRHPSQFYYDGSYERPAFGPSTN
jgi:hypothetical protein